MGCAKGTGRALPVGLAQQAQFFIIVGLTTFHLLIEDGNGRVHVPPGLDVSRMACRRTAGSLGWPSM